MSRKISDFFKIQQSNNEAKVKQENEASFTISFEKSKVESSEVKIVDDKKTIKDTKIKKISKNMCKICDKKFPSNSKLNKHLNSIHTCYTTQYHCETFLNINSMNKHRAKHQENKPNQYECDFDGKIFKTKDYLRSHIRKHRLWIECEICHKTFSFFSSRYHQKTAHSVENNYNCKICLKNFKTLASLKRHEKNHNKKTECEICKRLFSGKDRLNEHIKYFHENPKSYECEICNKKFMAKSHLKNHQKTHEKNRPKPYKCQQCDYATDDVRSFNRHQKFHENQNKKNAAIKNPINCKICPKLFQNKKSLAHHMKSVHPKVLLQCDLCARFIKTRQHLLKHVKLHIKKQLLY